MSLKYIFEIVYKLSLRGRNIGMPKNHLLSGEKYALEFVKKHFESRKEDIVIFDVGANIGEYSKTVLSIFENNSKIYAFEPCKKTFEILTENLAYSKKANLYNLGFSDKKENVKLFFNKNKNSLSSVYDRNLSHLGFKLEDYEFVDLLSIDDFCSNNFIAKIHFLKLDVEGHELKVLNGARNLVENGNIEIIQFEFGGCNIDSRTYFQDFYYYLHLNFKIYRILKDGLYEIDKYSESNEVFIQTNYLAIKNKARTLKKNFREG